MNQNDKKLIFGMGLFSLILRIAVSLHSDFAADQEAIYDLGLKFYHTGTWVAGGAKVVYSGTRLPGALQSLLTGAPLLFSQGLPWSIAASVAIINFLAMSLLIPIFVKAFPKLPQALIAFIIWFSPWSIFFSSIWNPSYLPILCSLFLFSLSKVKESVTYYALIALVFVVGIQLHLSVVLLPALLILAWVRGYIPRPRLRAAMFAALGTLLGSVTLLPTLLHPTEETGSRLLTANIHLNPKVHEIFLNVFLRFVSFPTTETSRFIGKGWGFGGTLTFMKEHSLLIPFFVLGTMGALAGIVLAVQFYIHSRSRKECQLPWLRGLTLGAPFVASVFFVFSVKAPSAHTFWILMPLAFVPLLSGIQFYWKPKWTVPIVLTYLSTLIFTLPGYLLFQHRSLWEVQKTLQTTPLNKE